MKESSTYQAILEEGRIEGRTEGRAEGAVAEVKKLLRRLGDRMLGTPDEQTAATIERLDNLAQLEELHDRLPNVGSWRELFGEPAAGRRSGRRRSS